MPNLFLFLKVEKGAFTPLAIPEGEHRLQSQYCLWYRWDSINRLDILHESSYKRQKMLMNMSYVSAEGDQASRVTTLTRIWNCWAGSLEILYLLTWKYFVSLTWKYFVSLSWKYYAFLTWKYYAFLTRKCYVTLAWKYFVSKYYAFWPGNITTGLPPASSFGQSTVTWWGWKETMKNCLMKYLHLVSPDQNHD